MAEIVLQRPSIHALIGQLKPGRMPQHVGMGRKRHLGGRPKPRHHPAKGNCGHRSAAFAHEDISAGFLFALETAQGAKFDASQWVDGGEPIFESVDMQPTMDEIGLIPAQRTQFGCSRTMPEGHQDPADHEELFSLQSPGARF